MKKIFSALLTICCLVLFLTFSANSAEAASGIVPTASDNLRIRLRSNSGLAATDDGYMRVFYDGNRIGVEYYDNSFAVKSRKFIAMELPIWGGFYAGADAYYIVEGQNNTAENDSAEVIRVIKYDTRWNKKGTAKITGNPQLFGGEVRYPFDYGCVEMTEYNGTLYIVTGHQGYVDASVGQGHQGFLMIAVDEAEMTGEIVDSDLWHSFAQYIDNQDSDLYVLEQSEGSRYTKLSKYNTGNLKQVSIPVLNYGGDRTSAWAIACFASVDGMALSSDHVLCLGTSIDQSKYDSVSSSDAHNIYLTVTPMSDFSGKATTVKWLTNYSGDGKSFLGTKITKINDNRFMVSWEEYGSSQTASTEDTLSGSILHYVFIDGRGNKVSKEFTAAAPISDCQPIVKGSKVVYCASNSNMVNFYSIDGQTGAFSKKAYRVAGENATWKLDKNVLTISGTGAISVDASAGYRPPISSTAGGFSYSSSDNVWAPIRENVNKIVISKGITDIPKEEFAYFNNLKEVELASGVKSIGEKAFYSCEALSKITIPASVTSIGEDILWTGYLWTYDGSHVVNAVIYGDKGSMAEKYAKENDIEFMALECSHTWNSGKVTKAATCTADGVKTYTCTKCKATKTEAIKATGHSYDAGKVTKAPTATTTGVKTYTCTKCKATKTETIKATGLKTPVLTATVNANGTFTLSWNKVTGAEKYELYIKQADGSYKLMKTTTATSFTTAFATYGKQFSYKMRAVTGSVKSAYSAVVNATNTKKLQTPTVKATVNANGTFKLSWNKVTGAEKYELYIKQADGSYKLMKTTTATSFTTAFATYGKQFSYKMRAVTGSVKSAYSAVVNATNTKKLQTPTLKATVNANGTFTLSWNKVTGAEKYELYIKQADGSYKLMKTTTATSFTTAFATYGKQFSYKMRALTSKNSSATSAYSSAVNATNNKKLQTPTLKVAVNKNGSFKLSWGKVTGATSYQIYMKQSNGSYKLIKTTSSTSFTTAVAAKGKTYSYKVRAVTSKNKNAASNYSNAVNAKRK